jgi:hypothetical protein
LEHSYPVDRDTHPAAHGSLSSGHTSPWNSAGNKPFVAQIEELLGECCGLDPLFFVESWTLGVAAAADNLQARSEAVAHRDHDTSSFGHFEFFVPLLIAEEETRNAPVNRSPCPAWKEAYFAEGLSAQCVSTTQQDDAAFGARRPGEPLTAEEACRVLGVPAASTRNEIRTAYRHLVRRYHPDRFEHRSELERRTATERMIFINEAYHLLWVASGGAAF